MPSPAPDAANPADPAALPAELGRALRQLLEPLARLALAQGLTHAALDELLKQALVQAADSALDAVGDLPPHRRASRITTTTGIHRREVTRLQQLRHGGLAADTPAQRSHASELFAHWRSHVEYCDSRGSPRELPRQGPLPSFETLAQGITTDVHPRSLLDELLRLGLAAWDRERDTVRLLRESFVPSGDTPRMLRWLGLNVGSHLEAAVDNLLQGPARHFEQAVAAPGLSDASLAEWHTLVQAQWQALLDTLVPRLEQMIARDAADPVHAPRHRVRLGLYTYEHPEAAAPAAPAVPPSTRPPRRAAPPRRPPPSGPAGETP